MALSDDLERIAAAAAPFAESDEALAGILAAEPAEGVRAYVCAFEGPRGRTWLALDEDGRPIDSRTGVRDAVSIAAMCELAVDSAAGGDVEELRAQLLAVRLRENPPGIADAEEAALELERVIGLPPHLASAAYLDQVGAATRRLEQALGENGASPFAEAMKSAVAAVDEVTTEVERNYKLALR